MAEDPKAKYAIHEACREGLTTKAQSLLQANPKLTTLRDPDDRLPLHWATSYNHTPLVTLLIDNTPRRDFDIDAPDGSGWTPLHMACSRKDGDDMVRLLLAHSADVRAVTNAGQTPLHFTVSKANLDVARLLLSKGASARVKDKRGQLPLHRAAAVGSVPMVKLLLSEGKSPLNATDVDGMTALHHAVAEGHGDAALALLMSGAEYDVRDRDGKVALELAPDAKTRRFIVQAAEREGIDLEG